MSGLEFVIQARHNTVPTGIIHTDPNAALLFIDVECGDLLQLVITADVIWQGRT